MGQGSLAWGGIGGGGKTHQVGRVVRQTLHHLLQWARPAELELVI